MILENLDLRGFAHFSNGAEFTPNNYYVGSSRVISSYKGSFKVSGVYFLESDRNIRSLGKYKVSGKVYARRLSHCNNIASSSANNSTLTKKKIPYKRKKKLHGQAKKVREKSQKKKCKQC